jgi:hypothetical protein
MYDFSANFVVNGGKTTYSEAISVYCKAKRDKNMRAAGLH